MGWGGVGWGGVGWGRILIIRVKGHVVIHELGGLGQASELIVHDDHYYTKPRRENLLLTLL